MNIVTAGDWYLAEMDELVAPGGVADVSPATLALLLRQASRVSQNSAGLYLNGLGRWRLRLADQFETRRSLAVAAGLWGSWLRITLAAIALRLLFAFQRLSLRAVQKLVLISDGLPNLRQE